MTDGMTEWLTQSALRVQTCIAMSALRCLEQEVTGPIPRADYFKEGFHGFLYPRVNAKVNIRS